MNNPHPEIPTGNYCYNKNGVCPYWEKHPEHGAQNDGYCVFLELGDWDADENGMGFTLLWDQCKECDINRRGRDELQMDG